MYLNLALNNSSISTMKSILVICCVFALSDALSLSVPVKDYPTKFVYNDNEAQPIQLIELVADEEQLLNERVGRQNLYGSIPVGNNVRAPIQSKYSIAVFMYNVLKQHFTDSGGYVSNGYRNYQSYPNYQSYQSYPNYQSYQSNPSYPNYKRRNFLYERRRRFGGIGTAIIV